MADETREQIVREWIAGLLLPVAIFFYGCQKDMSDAAQRSQKDKSDIAQREQDRVIAIIKSLGSSSEAERDLAKAYITDLDKKGEAPDEAVALLQVNLRNATTSKEAASAADALTELQNSSDKSLKSAAQNVVSSLPARLYIQIRTEADRSVALEIQHLLTNIIRSPGIELVAVGPSTSEVRFFHPEDQALAKQIADSLTACGVTANPKDASGFAKNLATAVPQKQLELWLAAKVTLKPSCS